MIQYKANWIRKQPIVELVTKQVDKRRGVAVPILLTSNRYISGVISGVIRHV